jgi:nickel transport protein
MRTVISLFLGLCTFQAIAHDLWISHEGINYALHQGHAHSAHAGADVVPYNPVIVKNVLCAKPGGGENPLIFGKTYPVKFSGECCSVLVSLSSGYWTKTVWETKNVPKTGIAGVLKSWRSQEAIKRINMWTPGSAKPIGKGLEISPQSDPFKLGINDKLSILVTDNGKPMAGVPVAYQGDTRGVSGLDGLISIRIRKAGVQLISASMETPLSDGKADTIIRSTTLQFELPK